MTLDQLIQQLRKPPKPGAHEVVHGPDGLDHLVIIVGCHDDGGRRSYDLMGWCDALNGLKARDLEVAKDITCLKCVQWKTV